MKALLDPTSRFVRTYIGLAFYSVGPLALLFLAFEWFGVFPKDVDSKDWFLALLYWPLGPAIAATLNPDLGSGTLRMADNLWRTMAGTGRKLFVNLGGCLLGLLIIATVIFVVLGVLGVLLFGVRQIFG